MPSIEVEQDQPAPAPRADTSAYLREYVSGGYSAAIAAVRQCLPLYIDDITRDLGSDTYERMLTDSDVASAFDLYKLGILSDGIRVDPAVSEPGEWENPDPDVQARAQTAKEYAEFVARCVANMDGQPIDDIADNLLDGIALGHKCAEIVLKHGIGEDAGRLVVRAVKPKKRKTVAFVVDEYGNTVGLIGANPRMGSVVTGTTLLVGDIQNFVPRDKCVIYQHAVKDGDPRGTSALRPAYLPWFIKTQIIPEYFKFLKQFASPGIIGKTPEVNGNGGFVPMTDTDGVPVLKSDGTPVTMAAEQALMNALLGWMNATVLVVKGGTEVDFLQSQGDGVAFLNANDYFARQIHQAILGTALMTMESKHANRATGTIGQDTVGLKIAFQKGRLAGVLTRDLAATLIRLNFGEEALTLCPKFTLTEVERQDFAAELDAVAKAYASGYVHESQLPALDARLGMPPRDMAAIAREKSDKQHMARLAAGDLNNVRNPGLGEDGVSVP
jgi:hypothetical protein